ncbi:hypothetical protein TrVFT333_009672 [Trichoderma virens FT-333]|nr:hypothetical protein TrVFT333_009672 [Trichoderma virens FT-333]
MPSSSTHTVRNGCDNNTKPHADTNGRSSSHSYRIDRFLADPEQRCPTEFGKIQSPAEAEAAAKARMTARLRAFEAQFGSSGKPPGNNV